MQPSPRELAATLYAELVERSQTPTDEEFEALCARHPELAHELRALNKTRWMLEELGNRPSAQAPPKPASAARDAEVPKLAGFRFLQLLGQGGMGEVWEALDLALHRRVAIKLLAPLSSHSDRERERLRREALAAARLRHPNVVALFSSSEHAGRPYLVQELIEGGRTLRDELEELRRLGTVPEGYERKVAERFVALADALALAHSEGVVHRDIKPQNILLERDGRPKLADFGLAKTAGEASLSVTGEFVGTYLYASPEQVAAKSSIGPASDIFSLGVTLYECLTLQRPFGGDSVQAITRTILHDDPPSPRVLRRRIDRDLSVICLHMLEKRPEARYASMAALREDLRRYLAGTHIHARPPSLARRMQRSVHRHPTAATAILLTAAGFAAILMLLGRTKHARDELAVANERLIGANAALESARIEAQTQADTSAEIVAFLSGLFFAGDPLKYGAEPSLKDVILKGSERLRSGDVQNPAVRATLLGQLGVLLSRLGYWSEAESMLSEASSLLREQGHWDTIEGVETRVALAEAYWDECRIAECSALLEPLFERARTPDALPDMTRFEILGVMGFVLTEAGDPVAGEAQLREALELAKRLPEDEQQSRVRSVRVHLSAALLRQGKYPAATELIEPLCVELAPLLPAGNIVALDAFNIRGKLRLEQGRLDEALSDCESTLSAAEAKLGAQHPRSINLTNNLATCFIALRRWDDAEQLLRHAVELGTETMGEDSRETLTALYNLGTVLIGTNRFAEAEEVLSRVLDLELQVSGEDDIRTARARTNLAICMYHLQRFGEAAELQERALASVSPDLAEHSQMESALAIYRKLAAGN